MSAAMRVSGAGAEPARPAPVVAPKPPDRATLLRQFAALPPRSKMSFILAAMHVYAEEVTEGGMVLQIMCDGLAECDRAMARRRVVA